MADERPKLSIVSLADESDCEMEMIERNREETLVRWSNKLLQFALAFLACNPFPLSKQGDHNLGDHLGQRISCDTSGSDERRRSRQREKWTKMYLLVCTYLALKPVAAFCLRFTINLQNENRGRHSSNSTQPQQNLEHLLDFVGDPYCSLAQLTPLVYLGAPMAALLFNCFRTYYFRVIHPFDCSVIRFLLDPKREIRRVDSAALEKVNHAFEGVERRRRVLESLLEERRAFRTLDESHAKLCELEHNRLCAVLQRLMNQSNALRHLRLTLNSIRPKSFNSDWYKYCSHSFLFVSITLLVMNSSFYVLSEIIISYLTWRNRCDRLLAHQVTVASQTSSPDCSISELFTPAELLSMLEEDFSLNVFTCSSFSIFFLFIHFQIDHQDKLTDSTNDNLAHLLDELRSLSQKLGQRDGGEAVDEQKRTMELAGELDQLMYKNVIGLWIFGAESRRNIEFLANLTHLYIVLVFTTTLVAFGMFNSLMTARSVGCRAHPLIRHPTASESSKATQAGEIGFITWAIVWCYANSMMLLCAAIPARISRLKSLVTSIDAQMALVAQKQDLQTEAKRPRGKGKNFRRSLRSSDLEQEANNPLLTFWRKIVLAGDFAKERYSVFVFNFELTHVGILKLNYYVVVLSSWLSVKYFS